MMVSSKYRVFLNTFIPLIKSYKLFTSPEISIFQKSSGKNIHTLFKSSTNSLDCYTFAPYKSGNSQVQRVILFLDLNLILLQKFRKQITSSLLSGLIKIKRMKQIFNLMFDIGTKLKNFGIHKNKITKIISK